MVLLHVQSGQQVLERPHKEPGMLLGAGHTDKRKPVVLLRMMQRVLGSSSAQGIQAFACSLDGRLLAAVLKVCDV